MTHVIYFDFAKAFDSGNHDTLLCKMKNFYKIDDIQLKFLTNYIHDMHQHLVGALPFWQ